MRRKRKRICQILVVAKTAKERQALESYYLNNYERKKYRYLIRRAGSINEAKEKVDCWVSSPEIVIFSRDFTQEQKDELRLLLNCLSMASLFIVPPPNWRLDR